MRKLFDIINTIEQYDGKCYYVGGYVRDKLLGIDSEDIDIEVYNINFNDLIKALSSHGELEIYDKFYIAKIKAYPQFEFALPRMEVKTGSKHTDFKVITSSLTKEQASIRRDFTINAIMMDCKTEELFDYYGGIKDLHNGVIRHISDKFSEDPLRILRAIRFSAQLGFAIDKTTLQLCKSFVDELDYISNERFSNEFMKFIGSNYVQNGLIYLQLILEHYFKINCNEFYDFSQIKESNLRVACFFYSLKKCSLDKIIAKLILTKDIRNDVMFITKVDFESNMYEIFEYFKTDAITLYKVILNVEVETSYNYYLSLKLKYNGNYFINKGFSGSDIKSEMKTIIKKELEEYYVFYNGSK